MNVFRFFFAIMLFTLCFNLSQGLAQSTTGAPSQRANAIPKPEPKNTPTTAPREDTPTSTPQKDTPQKDTPNRIRYVPQSPRSKGSGG